MRDRAEALINAIDDRLATDLRNGLPLAVKLALRVARGRSRAIAFGAGLLYGTGRWNRPIRLELELAGATIPWEVPDFAAYKVLGEVLLNDTYADPVEPAPTAILDLGAHVGTTALYFRRRFPQAQIVCLEASPQLVHVLRRNVAPLDVTVRHAALAGRSGTITFYEDDDSWAGSTSGSGRPVEVDAVTLDDLLAEHPAELVKMDVEGAEFEALATAGRHDQPAMYMGEVHAELADPRTREILERFADVRTVDCGGVTLFTGLTRTA
jgi:FkbM family methyltransferase